MKDYELATRHEIEVALLQKGQESKRYELGDIWELNYNEIREALDNLTPNHQIANNLIQNLDIDIKNLDFDIKNRSVKSAMDLKDCDITIISKGSAIGIIRDLKRCMKMLSELETKSEIVHCKDCKK